MGRCRINCTDLNFAFAILLEKKCWCSSTVPNKADQNDISDCSFPCPGYPDDICGGKGPVYGYLEIAQFKPTATAPPASFSTTRQPSKTASVSTPQFSSAQHRMPAEALPQPFFFCLPQHHESLFHLLAALESPGVTAVFNFPIPPRPMSLHPSL